MPNSETQTFVLWYSSAYFVVDFVQLCQAPKTFMLFLIHHIASLVCEYIGEPINQSINQPTEHKRAFQFFVFCFGFCSSL
jgi:hypothetical protein